MVSIREVFCLLCEARGDHQDLCMGCENLDGEFPAGRPFIEWRDVTTNLCFVSGLAKARPL